MRKNILTVLLLLSLQLAGCTNNVQQIKSKDDYKYTDHNIDEGTKMNCVDYKLCSKKIESLIKFPDTKHFYELIDEFINADVYSESLLYCLVAANKLGIDEAKIRVASCLSESLSNPNVGKNSKELSLEYLKKWESSTKHKRGKQIIERFKSLPKNDTLISIPTINHKSPEIQLLKTSSLKGNVEDYKKLKEKMYNDEMYVFLLYYAYIMADRYSYVPAKKDIIDIINRFFCEHNLGDVDDDTKKIYEYL